jgi:hypothetical protein
MLSGDDLKALGIPPGPRYKEILAELCHGAEIVLAKKGENYNGEIVIIDPAKGFGFGCGLLLVRRV